MVFVYFIKRSGSYYTHCIETLFDAMTFICINCAKCQVSSLNKAQNIHTVVSQCCVHTAYVIGHSFAYQLTQVTLDHDKGMFWEID